MKKSKVLIFGGAGLVGSKFIELNKKDFQIKAPDILETDILSKSDLKKVFEDFMPDVVINFAAFTNVEEAEKEVGQKHGLCYLINAIGAKNVAEFCKKFSSFLIYISTEYVFDGTKNNAYDEEDEPNPINWYGKTKYFGEQFVLKNKYFSCIARISMPFSAKYALKKDVARFFLEQLKNKKEINAIKDQQITPTLVDDIAKALGLIAKIKPTGIFHVCTKTSTTPYKFAKLLVNTFNLDITLIKPISFKSYNAGKSAKLLKNSWLDSNKFIKTFGDGVLHSIKEELVLFKAQLIEI